MVIYQFIEYNKEEILILYNELKALLAFYKNMI